MKIHYLSKTGTNKLNVDFSSSYNRDTSNKNLETHIEKIWAEKCSKNSKLFNASKFRLNDLQVTVDDESDKSDTIHLQIGITSYKEHCATDYNVPYSINKKYAANKIATGGVILTSDDCLMVQKRAKWVNSSPGMYDCPGGHPEPDNVDFEHDFQRTSGNSVSLNDRVAEELLIAQKNEICEELNIKLNEITSHKLHSIIACPYKNDPTENSSWSRPVFYFITKCTLSSQEIIKRHSQGGNETDEAEKLETWMIGHCLGNFRESEKFSPSGFCALGTFLYCRGEIGREELVDKVMRSCRPNV